MKIEGPVELTTPLLLETGRGAKRFLGMGFRLTRLGVSKPAPTDYNYGFVHNPHYALISGEFICVCNRVEGFIFEHHIEQIMGGTFTVYDLIESAGALNRDHLLADGYTVEQIDDMERRAGVKKLTIADMDALMKMPGGYSLSDPRFRLGGTL